MIHVIGDSHVNVFMNFKTRQMIPEFLNPSRKESDQLYNGRNGCFACYRIPSTAYSIETKKDLIEYIFINYCKPTDFFLFVYGEIDCRYYLPMHTNIREVAERYINFLLKYKDLGMNVGIFCPPPTWHYNKPYCGPSNGDHIERNIITREFINDLFDWSDEIKVFSIFEEMVTEYLETKYEYLDDTGIHLNKKAYPLIIEELKEVIEEYGK